MLLYCIKPLKRRLKVDSLFLFTFMLPKKQHNRKAFDNVITTSRQWRHKVFVARGVWCLLLLWDFSVWNLCWQTHRHNNYTTPHPQHKEKTGKHCCTYPPHQGALTCNTNETQQTASLATRKNRCDWPLQELEYLMSWKYEIVSLRFTAIKSQQLQNFTSTNNQKLLWNYLVNNIKVKDLCCLFYTLTNTNTHTHTRTHAHTQY